MTDGDLSLFALSAEKNRPKDNTHNRNCDKDVVNDREAGNTDILGELKRLAESVDFDWITFAADRLADVERGMRRNLLRSLSLDAFAAALEKTGT
jgi:hypothetical protein